ncbi:MAG TPA: hypothetical protein VM734_34165 [Kofleriaceae bacterium]|jgi:hypothetical protein|nr:hypothetical protein [Kofleriaceae bacterium]
MPDDDRSTLLGAGLVLATPTPVPGTLRPRRASSPLRRFDVGALPLRAEDTPLPGRRDPVAPFGPRRLLSRILAWLRARSS